MDDVTITSLSVVRRISMPRTSRVCAVAFVIAAVAGTGSAQQRPVPDFSGKWTLVGAENPIYTPFGAEFTVTQDATSFTITSARDAMIVKLDGSDTDRTTTTVRGDQWKRVTQGKLVTFALVITTKVDAGVTGRWEDLVVLSLGGAGKLTLVSCATAKSMEPAMITRMFKYEKQNGAPGL
jgi:hypothetical protein